MHKPNSGMSRLPVWLRVCLIALLALGPVAPVSTEEDRLMALPGGEIMLPEEVVKDRFFAYLIALAEADAYGYLRSGDINAVLSEFLGNTSVPFELITGIERGRGEQGRPGSVSISFLEPLKTPVPYSILGYHPGSVWADTTVRFHEYYLPAASVSTGGDAPVELTQVHVFAVYEGWAVVDIDAWVDKILGGRLDDTWLIVLALFKYEGDWHGIAAGFGPSGEGRSGVFNFRTDKILFPTPDQFMTLGPYFRNLVRSQKGVRAPVPGHGKWVSK